MRRALARLLINQYAIQAAGLVDSTDLTDWALLDYIHSWQHSGQGDRIDGHVRINDAYLMRHMPLLKIHTQDAVSARISKLRTLGLVTTVEDKTQGLFVAVTGLFIAATQFSGKKR